MLGFTLLVGTADAQEKPAYSKMSPYTSILIKKAEQGILKKGDSKLRSLSEEEGQTYIAASVKLAKASGWDDLTNAGCIIQTKIGLLGTAKIPLEKIEEISQLESVTYISAARTLEFRMDSAVIKSNVVPAQDSTNSAIAHPYTGEGVIVGVVDGGFDYTHPTFVDNETGECRISYVWDQNANNAVYTTPEEIQAARHDNQGMHGSHVAGIAGGSGYTTPYRGVAYKSDLQFVSTTQSYADIINAVQQLFDNAEEAGKPCVVNISLGSNVSGAHDGTDEMSQMFDQMVGPGRIIVVSAGNEQSDSIYVEKSADETMIGTGFISDDENEGEVDLWATEKDQDFMFGLHYISVEDRERKVLFDSISVKQLAEDGRSLYSALSSSGNGYYITIAGGLYEGNDLYNAAINIQPIDDQTTQDVFLLYVYGDEGTTVQVWGTSKFQDFDDPDVLKAGSGYSSVGLPATCKSVIAAGSYNNRTRFTNVEDDIYQMSIGVSGGLSNFSSLGPTSDGRIKPEVTAPGGGVISATNSYDTTEDVSAQTIAYSTYNGRQYGWVIENGTSMASPFTAGTIALWLQADPTLTTDDIKEIIAETAIQEEGVTYPNNQWGYGKIDAYNGLLKVISKSTATEKVPQQLTAEEAVTVYKNGRGSFHLRWAEAPGTFTVHVYDVNGRHIYGERVDNYTSIDYPVTLNGAADGTYFINIETAAGTVTRKVIL